jgi:short-subunit dehydrogenase
MKTRTGKTALVTGASSGIGLELARCFAADGHDVVLVARSGDQLELLAQSLAAEHGIDATPLAMDLFDPEAPQRIYDAVRARGTTIDFLVNDAGQGVYGKFVDNRIEDELRIIQLNVNALVVLTKLFLKDMVARGAGRVLQLASIVSKAPAPYAAVYSATKAFIYNFSEAVNQELQGTGVTMTALRPGATDTDFFHKAHAEEMKIYQEGKLAPPEDVARAGYEAMLAGEDHVVAGLANKLQDAAGNLMPDTVVAKRMKKAHEPTGKRSH